MNSWKGSQGVEIFKMEENEVLLQRIRSVYELIFKSDYFLVEGENGLWLGNHYLAQELVINILSYVDPKDLLKLTLVCKRWCHFVHSNLLWRTIYERQHKRKAKKLPWFVYYCLFVADFFDTNFLKNGNGQEGYKHWHSAKSFTDEFRIEDAPKGSDPLPPNILEFFGHKSCFSTSCGETDKFQIVPLDNNILFSIILDYYKPEIYASEWYCGRFDTGCTYTLKISARGKRFGFKIHEDSAVILKETVTTKRIKQWLGKEWAKLEVLLSDYPEGVRDIIFSHRGKDSHGRKCFYGSKMAGGVVKIIFDSIVPKDHDIFLDDL